VTIHSVTVTDYAWPLLSLDIHCGKGTYVRSIARELGQALGTGGHCTMIRRTAVGTFTIDRAVSMDAKRAGSKLVAVGVTTNRLGGSHFAMLAGTHAGLAKIAAPCLKAGPANAAAVARAIGAGLVRAAHDASEGGILVAAAEMAFSGALGVSLDLSALPCDGDSGLLARCFAEDASRYLLEVEERDLPALSKQLGSVPHAVIGTFDASGELALAGPGGAQRVKVRALGEAWSGGMAAGGLS
jgi:phosphoribosylformylglycinamidine synthase